MNFFYSPYYGFGPGMFLLFPAIILAMYAQGKVRSTFNKYLRVMNSQGITGAQAARMILDRNGLRDIRVEPIGGYLSDHYDPKSRVLRLSPQVHNSNSIAAISVAAHEAGHAMQHGAEYIPLTLRNTIAPIASFASQSWMLLVFAGFLLGWANAIDLAILLYLSAVVFHIITLPVEYNASSRALEALEANGLLLSEEVRPAKKVLNAAALTYVAAAAVSIAHLLRLLMIRGRRD
ncbi:MAG: zinc metallopeptidase [Bacillota bacterium]